MAGGRRKFKRNFKSGSKRKKKQLSRNSKKSKDQLKESQSLYKKNPNKRQKKDDDEPNKSQMVDSSSEEEEATPYSQLLTLLYHKENSKNKVLLHDTDELSDVDVEHSEHEINEGNSDNKVSTQSEDEDQAMADKNELEEVKSSGDEVEEIDENILIDEKEEDLEEMNSPENVVPIHHSDPFVLHFEKNLPEESVNKLSQANSWQKSDIQWSALGRLLFFHCENSPCVTVRKTRGAKGLYVKQNVYANLAKANSVCLMNKDDESAHLSTFQAELFSVILNYQDLYYSERSLANGEEIRLVYSLHALNHVLKTRSRIFHHNSKINKKNEVSDDYRDHGLTRPKVLIIVPFKEAALRTINLLSSLLFAEENPFVTNKKRFFTEYGSGEDPKMVKKPDDYKALFAGNIEDCFRIGIAVSKKSLKLYVDFYSADIIIASPLGLRTIITGDGKHAGDIDFLSSIEILILDQTDVYLMQNWEHLLLLMKHLHMQPRESHGVDFSRVRIWTLNGWSKYYRQTLLFSNCSSAEINSIFNKCCLNFSGKVKVFNPLVTGSICHIVTQLPQVFQKFPCQNIQELSDARFNYFVQKILPQYRDSVMSHTLIFIPSYLDFVRVRNYFKKEEISFVQACEYTKDGKIARARNMFYRGYRHFLLYTERLHFFHRFRIKGVKHLIFYEPPLYSHFYSEICNTMHDSLSKDDNMSCMLLYSRYDIFKLAGILGTDQAYRMIESDKQTHMMVTGEF